MPATKAGLIPFLNDLERQFAAPPADWREEVIAEHNAEPAPAPRLAPVPAAPTVGDVGATVEWIMDSASQSQVEQIFTALGVRFGEAIRPRRAA